jgi:hypothetical protein
VLTRSGQLVGVGVGVGADGVADGEGGTTLGLGAGLVGITTGSDGPAWGLRADGVWQAVTTASVATSAPPVRKSRTIPPRQEL